MPEIVTTTLDSPAQLRTGDILRQVDPTTFESIETPVYGTKAGTSRVYLLDENGEKTSTWLYLSQPVTVLRSQKTEAEKAAELADRIQDEANAIVLSLQVMAATDPMAVFAKHAATEDPEHATWQLKRTLESYTDELFIGTCLKEFAQKALAVAAHEEANARRTVEIAVGMAREDMLRGLDRFGSRSTSHFSNLLEDAERAARARWLDAFDVRYYLAKVEREVVA